MTTNTDTISTPKTRKVSTLHFPKKAPWIALAVLLIALAGGLAYYKLTS